MSTATTDPARRRSAVELGIVLLAVVAATALKLGNGLVWDDIYVIGRGSIIHDPSQLDDVFLHRTMYVSENEAPFDPTAQVDTYRPVTLGTFFFDSMISGREPWSYHVTNLVLHLLCVCLVFALVRRLVPPPGRVMAPVAAAWFGLTPHLAEAHVWIDGRSDPLCTMFGLGALHVLIGAMGARGSRLGVLAALAGVLFFAGLLSKEVLLLALPAMAIVPVAGAAPSWRQRLVASSGLVAAAVAYVVIRMSVLSGMRAVHGTDQLLAALVRVPVLWADGLSELLVPRQIYVRSLSDDYHALGLGLVIAIGVAVLAVAALVVRAAKRAPLLAWSLFFFASTLAPAAVIATMLWPGFGRYLYLPAAGLAIGVADRLGHLLARVSSRPRAKRLLYAGIAVWLVVLGARLVAYVPTYRDDLTLWGAVIEAAPDRAHGYGYVGMTYLELERTDEAIAFLGRAEALDPNEPRYLTQLAWALHVAGRTQASLDMCATGLHRFPEAHELDAVAARNLAGMRPDLAARHLVACLDADPGQVHCRNAARDIFASPLGGPVRAALAAELAGGEHSAAAAALAAP